MENRLPLGRIIILVSFAIIALIIYSVRLSNRPLYNPENPVFKIFIPWKYEDTEHQLLLHSIDFGMVSFTAYNAMSDTIIRMSASEQEIEWLQNQLLRFKSPHWECSYCHK